MNIMFSLHVTPHYGLTFGRNQGEGNRALKTFHQQNFSKFKQFCGHSLFMWPLTHSSGITRFSTADLTTCIELGILPLRLCNTLSSLCTHSCASAFTVSARTHREPEMEREQECRDSAREAITSRVSILCTHGQVERH